MKFKIADIILNLFGQFYFDDYTAVHDFWSKLVNECCANHVLCRNRNCNQKCFITSSFMATQLLIYLLCHFWQ